jgi:hypothetical protein
MAVRLSALRTGRPLPPGRFLVLISVRGWINSRAVVRLEGLGHLKNPITSSGVEPATFRLVTYCLNHSYTCSECLLFLQIASEMMYCGNEFLFLTAHSGNASSSRCNPVLHKTATFCWIKSVGGWTFGRELVSSLRSSAFTSQQNSSVQWDLIVHNYDLKKTFNSKPSCVLFLPGILKQ